mmetsp:Transcript_11149/g.17908  ORF Transcript_11149/g.17908 Transcript_11149/m.17908 type:complete len:231 (-) Transcript_11149:197-889(-)
MIITIFVCVSLFVSMRLLLAQQPDCLYSDASPSSATIDSPQVQSFSNVPSSLPPELTIIIPLYNAIPFLGQLMDTLQNQTYLNLKLLFSIEPTEQAAETDRRLQEYHQKYVRDHSSNSPIRNITIYHHPNRLYYFENMNFLLKQVDTKYYSYMQCDDALPPNYYQELVKCLDENPQASSCFPKTMLWIAGDEYFRRRKANDEGIIWVNKAKSVVGPQHKRVESAGKRKST